MGTKLLASFTRTTCRTARIVFHPRIFHSTPNHQAAFKDKDVKRLRFYFLERFTNYLKYHETILEKRYPKAVSAYRVFMFGVKEFFKELKLFAKLVRMQKSASTYAKMNRKELELYYQLPKDMLKVAPVLIIGSLPFSNFFILPLLIWFPRQVLTHHFWNLQQKKEFTVVELQHRLKHNRPVFRHLQAQLRNVKDESLKEKWTDILGMIGSGVQPTVEQILECTVLFSEAPYSLKSLSRNHTKHLAKMHGIPIFWRRASILHIAGSVIHAMDMAMLREGGIHNMDQESLRTACIIRGLNPSNMKTDDMVFWLQQWAQISEATKGKCPSLLLHCSILLGYNQPSNWVLIYSKKN